MKVDGKKKEYRIIRLEEKKRNVISIQWVEKRVGWKENEKIFFVLWAQFVEYKGSIICKS